jgi:peroxiredoxin
MRKAIITLILVLIMLIPLISSALSVGDKASGFEAPSTHGNVILSEFEGRKNVVLAMYYADFTPA